MEESRRAEAQRVLAEQHAALWKDYYEARVPAELFHYTSGPSAEQILRSRSFYLSDVLSLNDASEIQHGRDLACELLDQDGSNLSRSLLVGLTKGSGLGGLGDSWFVNVLCFCEERDVLSQWRGYAPRDGVALGIDVARLQARAAKLEFAILRMLYDRARQREILVAGIARCNEVFRAFPPASQADADALAVESAMHLLKSICNFKHPAFHEEKEWRVMLIDPIEEARPRTEFRWRGSDLVPFCRLTFTPDLITRVVHAPGPASSVNDHSLPRLLHALGYPHVAIERSDIPLR